MDALKPILDFDSEALAMLQDLVSSAVLVSLIVAWDLGVAALLPHLARICQALPTALA